MRNFDNQAKHMRLIYLPIDFMNTILDKSQKLTLKS